MRRAQQRVETMQRALRPNLRSPFGVAFVSGDEATAPRLAPPTNAPSSVSVLEGSLARPVAEGGQGVSRDSVQRMTSSGIAPGP